MPPTPQPVTPPTRIQSVDPLLQQSQSLPKEEYSIDYLNAISGTQHKSMSKFAVFGLIGGVLLAAIFAVILISAPKSSSSGQLIAPISERINTLKSTTNSEQKRLKDTQLSETNAAFNSALGTLSTELDAIKKTAKIEKSVTQKASSAEKKYVTKLSDTFNKAYQRGTLDRAYASQMIYELTALESKLNALKRSSKSAKIDTYCDSALANIKIILASYSKYDASKQ